MPPHGLPRGAGRGRTGKAAQPADRRSRTLGHHRASPAASPPGEPAMSSKIRPDRPARLPHRSPPSTQPAIAWERVPAWRASDLADFRTGFAHTLRRMDRLQPALLVVCLGSTIGFAGSAGGAARTLAALAAGGLLVVLVGSVALLVPSSGGWSRPGRHRRRQPPRCCEPGGLAATWFAPPWRWAASPSPSPPPSCEHAVKNQGRQGGRDVAAQGVG